MPGSSPGEQFHSQKDEPPYIRPLGGQQERDIEKTWQRGGTQNEHDSKCWPRNDDKYRADNQSRAMREPKGEEQAEHAQKAGYRTRGYRRLHLRRELRSRW